MWNRAKVVIAPHGAGLSLMVGCRKDVHIIEILTTTPNLCFLELAAQLGLAGYHAALSTTSGEENLHADIDGIVTIVKKLLSLAS